MKTFGSLIIVSVLLTIMTPVTAGVQVKVSSTDTLYPPTNLVAINVEQEAFIEWDKPVTQAGQTPAGLLGYYIYRNDVSVYYINDPDQLFIYEYYLDPGTYVFKATAYYDLTPYGSPGQFAESAFSNSDTVNGGCACFSLWEPWDQASFTYNEWQFYPSQGNWSISVTEGNPLPTAVFGPEPDLYNFDCALYSHPISSYFLCANYTIEFDLKMVAETPGDSTRLYFELYYDSLWHTKEVFSNENTDGWIHLSYNVNEAMGIFYKLRFRAAGDSSSAIGAWMIDNIYANFSCRAPDTLQADLTETEVILSWPQPCRTADTIVYPNGFNIYRTDSTGNPPYYKLNEEIVTDTTYHDPIQASMRDGEFRYYVVAWYNECNSFSDTVFVSIPVGIGQPPEMEPFTLDQNIPNPASGVSVIGFTLPQAGHLSLDLFDLQGRTVMNLFEGEAPAGSQKVTLNTTSLNPGVYYYSLKTPSGKQTKKMVVVK